MPKKTNNEKRSPLKTIYIIAAIILVLILGSTYLYVKQAEKGLVSEAFFNLRITNVDDKPVKELITYTLPSGWSEDTNALYLEDNDNVLLKSADYAGPFSEDSSNRSGASIILSSSPKYRFMTITEYKFWHSLGENASDYKDIEIDGVNGIKEESSFYVDFLFIKGDYMIEISTAILSEDVSTEVINQYQKDIDSIINSIQFK